MGVAWSEEEGSPSCSIQNGKFTGRRKFRVAWADWPTFIGEIYGVYKVNGSTALITQAAPFPGVDYTYATGIEISTPDMGTPAQRASNIPTLFSTPNTYTHAIVDVTYSHLPPLSASGISGMPTPPAGTLLTYSENLSANYITVPGRAWTWDSDSTELPPDVNPGILLPGGDLNLAFMRVPKIPTAASTYRGKVNNATFCGHDTGTCLYLGAAIEREFQIVVPPSTPSLYRLTYHFQIQETATGGAGKGWNWFFRPDTGKWETLSDDDGDKPYLSGDFTNLFTLA